MNDVAGVFALLRPQPVAIGEIADAVTIGLIVRCNLTAVLRINNPRFRSRIRFPVRDRSPLGKIENVGIAGSTVEFYSFFQRAFSA